MTDETNVSTEDGARGADAGQELGGIIELARDHLAQLVAAKTEAQAYADALKQSQDTLSSLVEEAKKALGDAKLVANSITAAGEKITADQGVIATKSAHIQEAQVHADKVRAELDRLLTAATADATKAEGHSSRATTASEEISAVGVEMKAVKVAIDKDAVATTDALKRSENSAIEAKSLADRAIKIEEALKQYEAKLQDLGDQASKQLDTITGLLPGATSAGLASAFNSRASSFQAPQRHWQWIFIGSLLSLVALGVTGISHALFADRVLTYDELIRLWLTRLPVAGALLWLTLHAARESALAKRLEEDYGYKSAIASSFEGFHQQMTQLSDVAQPGSPVERLCADTLATIATPPGRIYDRHRLTVSPSHEVATLATAIVAALRADITGSEKSKAT
jgi:hypothetical protein